jgi:type VI secretion system protein ImpB
MDGKGGAEELIAKLINDRSLMEALTTAPKPDAEDSMDKASTDETSKGGD